MTCYPFQPDCTPPELTDPQGEWPFQADTTNPDSAAPAGDWPFDPNPPVAVPPPPPRPDATEVFNHLRPEQPPGTPDIPGMDKVTAIYTGLAGIGSPTSSCTPESRPR